MQSNPNLIPNVLPRSMEKNRTMLSPNSQRNNKSLKPKLSLMIPSILTNTKQTQFFFVFFFCFFFCFCAEQPKQAEFHTSTIQPKELRTSNPKWSPEPKIPRSKPIGGTKGLTNLTGSSGMRARHHHTKGDKSEMNRNDRN